MRDCLLLAQQKTMKIASVLHLWLSLSCLGICSSCISKKPASPSVEKASTVTPLPITQLVNEQPITKRTNTTLVPANPDKAQQPPTAQSAVSLATKVDDEAQALILRFLNSEDKSLNWKDFTQSMASIFDQDAPFKELAQTFKNLTSSTSTTYIGYQLSWYKNSLPPKTSALLHQYTASQLREIIAMRISLNPSA